MTGANDYRFKGARIMETGTDRLSALFALCQTANDRLDVDGHGRVTIGKYVPPVSRVPVFRIDLSDQRGVALDGLSGSTDYLETPNVVGVCYKYNAAQGGKSVQREINASAQVSSSSPFAHSQRGYTVTDFREVNDLTPATAARAQQLAAQYLANDGVEHVEWELSAVYLPIWEGDKVFFRLLDERDDFFSVKLVYDRNDRLTEVKVH